MLHLPLSHNAFDCWYLGLLYSVDQLFQGFLKEVDFIQFKVLVFFDPTFDGVETGLIEFLWLDKH